MAATDDVSKANAQPPQQPDEISNEFDLKRAEFLLKKAEVEERLRTEQRHCWFGSPLILGLVSGIVGLLGAGFGAVMQGYWNATIERQKFESGLIQNALEQANREEAARNLLFLVQAGLILNLDGRQISMLASKPDQLPLLHTRPFRSYEVRFEVLTESEINCPEGTTSIVWVEPILLSELEPSFNSTLAISE